jgi:hypothetical protein
MTAFAQAIDEAVLLESARRICNYRRGFGEGIRMPAFAGIAQPKD